MRIYLVRHGESEANVAGIINDDPRRPVSLTARGRDQARQAARGLGAVPFTRVYASRFPRAQETAAILLEALALKCPLQIDRRLDERLSGLDGLPVEAFNGLVRPDPVHISPEHGESFLGVMARMGAFLDALGRSGPADTILAVSHENPILATRALAGCETEQAVRGSVGHCEITVLDWVSENSLTQSIKNLEP